VRRALRGRRRVPAAVIREPRSTRTACARYTFLHAVDDRCRARARGRRGLWER
jgi:hypothetical protein